MEHEDTDATYYSHFIVLQGEYVIIFHSNHLLKKRLWLNNESMHVATCVGGPNYKVYEITHFSF